MTQINDPAVIERLIRTPATWAVVGLSTNRARAAYRVAAYLQGIGKTIVPVHPKAEAVHEATGYATLADIPGDVAVDVVDVFVNADLAGAVVDEAIARGARAVWLQLGVIDNAAAQRALDAGLEVVMDRCPAIEGPRILR
ncbi:CoA-binding protein [Pseudactinotalea terrae]|uniref:CoA-binding protein n=1 Tax=Pseudactinotalea terrae TaxID=1743262 RepID=UPI0012E2B1AE|nr:CoA-binding protein [Pseudactinotalea terrae]